jgi:MSHA type pilus biogenesis protein MshL
MSPPKLVPHLARRRALAAFLTGTLLALAACKSPEPSQPAKGWLVPPTNRAGAIPPERLPSAIAPAPVSSFQAPTNPAAASPDLTLGDARRLNTAPAGDQKLYSFSAKDLEVRDALALFARNNELNIVPDPDISGTVTVEFRNLSLEKSLDAILDTFGYFAEIDQGLIRVKKTKTSFFSIDYIRLTRTGSGSAAATITSGSAGGNGLGAVSGGAPAGAAGAPGMGGGGDGASVSISKADSLRFWDELEDQLKSLLSPVGKLAVNRTVGNIMVTDQKHTVDRIGDYLKQIKKSIHLQVDIEAQIFEVVFDDEFHFGIDWQNVMGSLEKWAISSGGFPVGIPSSRLIVDSPIGGLTPGAPALSLAITKDQSKVIIDALKEQGQLEVVSQPRIRTLNNQAALIKVGTDKPFFRQSTVVTTGTGPSQTATDVSIQTITIGTVLALTPQIAEDGWVTMDISPVITRLVDTVSGPDNSTAPEVDIKQASSLVRIREGTTVVIGGLIQNERYKTQRKVPILGDIPILGYPFRGVFDSKRRTELVIFITPTIVR